MGSFVFSKHAQARLGQRGRKPIDIELMANFGMPTPNGFVMTEQSKRDALQQLKVQIKDCQNAIKRIEKLSGWVAIVSEGEVITAYPLTCKRTRRRHFQQAS